MQISSKSSAKASPKCENYTALGHCPANLQSRRSESSSNWLASKVFDKTDTEAAARPQRGTGLHSIRCEVLRTPEVISFFRLCENNTCLNRRYWESDSYGKPRGIKTEKDSLKMVLFSWSQTLTYRHLSIGWTNAGLQLL